MAGTGSAANQAPKLGSGPVMLLVGLGNPGPDYAPTRHNIGFRAVDRICDLHRLGSYRSKFQSELASGDVGGVKVLAQKPMTFMNNSGQAVAEAARFHKVPLHQVVVIHDDLDLAPGKCRMKVGGGAGGHNGLRSIDAHLGRDYWRLRIGIGHPGDRTLGPSLCARTVRQGRRCVDRPLARCNRQRVPDLG